MKPSCVSPAIARKLLGQAQGLPLKSVPVLLEYCISDVSLASPQQVVQQVAGLPLIPMVDGSVAVIQKAAAKAMQQMLIIPNELELQLLRGKGGIRHT